MLRELKKSRTCLYTAAQPFRVLMLGCRGLEGEYTTFRKTRIVDQGVIGVHGEVIRPLQVVI